MGTKSRNDLDLQYSLTFINSIRCLLLPTFRALAAIVSEYSTVFTFSTEKPMLQNLILPYNKSRSTEGHHLNKLWWAGVPDATYQVSWKSVHWFRRRFLKGFYHIWAWRPFWSCDPDAATKILFPLPKEAPHKNWLWSAQRFLRRRCLSIVDGRRRTTDADGQDAGAWVYYFYLYFIWNFHENLPLRF